MTQFTEEWAEEQIVRARGGWKPTPAPGPTNPQAGPAHAPPPVIRKDRYRNSWEREYAAFLDLRKHHQEILDYRYEPVSFRLADGTHLRPDFIVVTTKGIEIHEVKGYKRDKWWAKFKIAAELYPWFRWLIYTRRRGGEWLVEEVGL